MLSCGFWEIYVSKKVKIFLREYTKMMEWRTEAEICNPIGERQSVEGETNSQILHDVIDLNTMHLNNVSFITYI